MPPFIKIFPRYGILNDINKPLSGPFLDLQRDNVPNIFRQLVKKNYTPDAGNNVGPFKAICLLVVTPHAPEAGGFISNYFSPFFSKETQKPKLIEIKARIPEIHASLPIPRILGPDSEDIAIVNMYPTFIAVSEDLEEPPLGSIVLVDFGNKENLSDPLYLKLIVKESLPSFQGSVNAKEKFDKICTGAFLSDSPKGNSLAKNPKNLKHVGEDILPRSRINPDILEIIRGPRLSEFNLVPLEKYMNFSNILGKLWIGNISSNGLEDTEHLDGKRDTLIFSSNKNDYTQPFEIIYYFHDIGEFGDNKDFNNRIINSIKELEENKRNVIIVIPELKWCQRTTKTNFTNIFIDERDNFEFLHKEVLGIIQNSFSNSINVGFVSLIAFGLGGTYLKFASIRKSLDVVKPFRIIFADASYVDFIHNVWDNYVNQNVNNVELDIIVQDKGASNIRAKDFMMKVGDGVKNVFMIELSNQNHKGIGDLSIGYVSDNFKGQELKVGQDKEPPIIKNGSQNVLENKIDENNVNNINSEENNVVNEGCIKLMQNLGNKNISNIGNQINIGMNTISGEIKKLSSDERNRFINDLSVQLGIEPELAKSFFKAESGGRSGFCGDRIVINFNPNVFGDPKRLLQFNISRSQIPWDGNTWRERIENWKNFSNQNGWFSTGGSCSKQEGMYKSLEFAANINEELAYRSIDMGVAQILGSNYNMMGFRSAKEMYQAFQNEETQVKSFFIYASRRQGLLQNMKDKNFLEMAKKYNGTGKEQLYASKIQNYYDQYKRQA